MRFNKKMIRATLDHLLETGASFAQAKPTLKNLIDRLHLAEEIPA